jgi:hypothetical protein
MDAWSSAVLGTNPDLSQLVWAQDFATALKERRAARDAEASARVQRMADNEGAPSPLDELMALAGGSGTGGLGAGTGCANDNGQANTPSSLVALRDALTAAGNDPEALAAVEAAWVAQQASATTSSRSSSRTDGSRSSTTSSNSSSNSLSNFSFSAQANATSTAGGAPAGNTTLASRPEVESTSASAPALPVGTAVRLVGLSNAAFNGQRGEVLTGLLDGADSGRQGVQLNGSGESIKVKRVNLLAE